MSGFAGAPTVSREDVSRAATERTIAAAVTERTTAAAVTERERIAGRIYSTEHHGRGWMVTLLLLLCLVHHLSAVFQADLSVSPGGTVTLPCDGGTDKDGNEVEMSWEFEDTTVCWFQNGTLCEHRFFVNRIQLGSIQQKNFSLVINPVRLQDQGGYTCLINGAEIQINHLFVRGVSVGGRKQRAAETPPAESDGLLCNLHENKDKEVPDENPPGVPSSVRLTKNWPLIVVIVGIVVIVVTGDCGPACE
nr:uncharacterized protein LOC111842725 isoform X2 [Paramormyrops kingsleyae]